MRKWSMEIKTAAATIQSRHFPKRRGVALAGYCAGKAIWIVSLALKNYKEGFKCPHCGGSPNMEETLEQVSCDTMDKLPNGAMFRDDPFIETSLTCETCHKTWTVRKKGDDVCLDFEPSRNETEPPPDLY